MAFLALMLLSLSSARAACEDPEALVARVEQAALDARIEDARAEMARAELAFGCTGTASLPLLARLWIAEGAIAHLEGDPSSRDKALASAARIAPGQWTAAFGAELEQAWRLAPGVDPGRGQLLLEGLPEHAVALLDGRKVTVPAELDSGLYLLQTDASGAPPLFSRIVLVPSDQTLVVQVEDPAEHSAPAPAPAAGRKKWPWLVAAGGAAALAGTSMGLAAAQDGRMEEAADPDSLDAAYGRQKGFAWTGYGLAGVSVALVGVAIAW